jgi:hypothetical protein
MYQLVVQIVIAFVIHGNWAPVPNQVRCDDLTFDPHRLAANGGYL